MSKVNESWGFVGKDLDVRYHWRPFLEEYLLDLFGSSINVGEVVWVRTYLKGEVSPDPHLGIFVKCFSKDSIELPNNWQYKWVKNTEEIKHLQLIHEDVKKVLELQLFKMIM
ncbi:hypothetical protein [Ekhidna sp.]|uniref:hypothetical protein n=1 Tax=Ekhidna sp. TaxID=2608089 RepID=UPI00329A1932